MATLRDVLDLCGSKGWVSAAEISKAFDLSPAKACDVLKACWEKGLLLPVDKAWFAPPVNKGPLILTGEEGAKRKTKWYRDEIDIITKAFEDDPDLAITVYEAANRFEIPINKVRKVLYLLVDIGMLDSQESLHGGAFGRKPFIFTRPGKSVEAKEAQLQEESKHRKQLRKAKRMVAQRGQNLDMSTGELTYRSGTEFEDEF